MLILKVDTRGRGHGVSHDTTCARGRSRGRSRGRARSRARGTGSDAVDGRNTKDRVSTDDGCDADGDGKRPSDDADSRDASNGRKVAGKLAK